jgi:catechol 2,3-dioxygenase-like lactoylglutathione lyase family enzyme
MPAEATMHRWCTRPVLFVSDVDRARNFYVGMPGFRKASHEGHGRVRVCQVDRTGSEIILCEDAGRSGKGRRSWRSPAAPADFRREIAEHSIPDKPSWWGHDVIHVDGPDGNELLFPLPDGDGAAGGAT